jgi:hypothetical protein
MLSSSGQAFELAAPARVLFGEDAAIERGGGGHTLISFRVGSPTSAARRVRSAPP